MKKTKRMLRTHLFIGCLVWAGAALGANLDEI